MLKKIELTGFKSFAKKTELSFTTPVTAIVGPNGSGKSNIVEAIRFVLGEQSTKSLRSKSGSDLIWKGSKALPALARASVRMTFDNKRKTFRLGEGSGAMLDYDEIEIAREIFRDGGSTYTLNGSEVRLKDIIELLSSVNIGASGHHIISQGEADRILSANARDRREMVEDALGLKLYQYRLRESERKLEKTTENMKEVEGLRREVAPHLRFLKKQVEKVEHAQELGVVLADLYEKYLATEKAYLTHKRADVDEKHRAAEKELGVLRHELESFRKKSEKDELAPVRHALLETEAALEALRSSRSELERTFARVETLLEVAQEKKTKSAKEGFIEVSRSTLISFKDETLSLIDEALMDMDIASLKKKLGSMKLHLDSFTSKYLVSGGNVLLSQTEHTDEASEKKLIASLAEAKEKLSRLAQRETTLATEKEALTAKIAQAHESRVKEERAGYELRMHETELSGTLRMLESERAELVHLEELFEEELKEGAALIGAEMTRFKNYKNLTDLDRDNRRAQEEKRKEIERVKIKLEEAGIGEGSDVLKEYEEVKARDEFLAKELNDLTASMATIKDVIRDLKETIDREFRVGIERINKVFQEFFALMFGGGSAFLSVVVEEKRKRKTDAEDEMEEEEGDEGFESGIEINVSLPHKKVKELMMLSGGERSLTSIALLFAMSQVNPPPFLVLDETDAALDEANSRRYGDMLEKLSHYSELIVVTHNRETMSRAQVLYGITLGADTASRLLSVKLDEAVKIAK